MVVWESWKNNGGIVLGLPIKQNKAKGYLKTNRTISGSLCQTG